MVKGFKIFCKNMDIEKEIDESLDVIEYFTIHKNRGTMEDHISYMRNILLPEIWRIDKRCLKTKYAKEYYEKLLSTIRRIDMDLRRKYDRYSEMLIDDIHYDEDEINTILVKQTNIHRIKLQILDKLEKDLSEIFK
jgi:hypothetical protein